MGVCVLGVRVYNTREGDAVAFPGKGRLSQGLKGARELTTGGLYYVVKLCGFFCGLLFSILCF